MKFEEVFTCADAAVSGPEGGDLLLSTLRRFRRMQTHTQHTHTLAQTLDPAYPRIHTAYTPTQITLDPAVD